MVGDGLSSPNSLMFVAFLNHLNGISECLRVKLSEKDTVNNWLSPLRIENGFLMGLIVKIKNPNVSLSIFANPYNLKCVVRLICLYVMKKRGGVSFEVIKTLPCV